MTNTRQQENEKQAKRIVELEQWNAFMKKTLRGYGEVVEDESPSTKED